MADCPLVLIRWLDSRQPSGQWRYLSALPDTRPVEVATVGWLVRDTIEAKVVCQNVGDLDHPEKAQASGIMTIPTRCVLSIERLTEVERDTSVFADSEGSADFAGSAGFATISVDRAIATEPTPQVL
ncbi:MAG: hypothetical protein ABW006_00385 [Hyphomicrobium sp.]